MKMKKTLSILLICLLLVLSFAGCKKKDKDIDDDAKTTEAPATPTPEPVTVQELLSSTESELKTIFTKASADGADDYKISFPDGKMNGSGLLKMKLNLLSLIKVDIDMNMNGNLTSKNNLGEGDMHLDLSMIASSMFSDSDETDSESSDMKFYIDNTNGDDITVFTNEDNTSWKKSTKSVSEMVEQYTSVLENYNVNVENEDTSNLFKDREKFTADKTKLTETADGYTISTAFTWEEFYNAFKGDMDKLVSDVAGGVASELSDSINVDEVVKEFFGNGTGKFTMNANYDKEKSLKDIRIKVDDFSLSAQIKMDEETTLPLSFSIASFDLSVAFDRDNGVSVSIPEDVRSSAVESLPGDDPAFPIDDIIGGNEDVDPDKNTDGNTDDNLYEEPDSITFENNGVYYLLVGGQTVSLPFPAEWNPERYDFSIDVYPEETLLASYTDSYVTIAENALSDDLSNVVSYYENELGATDYTVTYNGMTQPSYVFVINNDEDDYQSVLLLEYVPGAQYYLQVSIYDLTKTADPMELIQMFGISF